MFLVRFKSVYRTDLKLDTLANYGLILKHYGHCHSNYKLIDQK